MGAVFKARQPALDRMVALKILSPAMGAAPGFAERFNREARALARLSHPHIVAVYDFGRAGPLHYLAMEFVDGPNLREMSRTGRLPPDQALQIVSRICDALQFAHGEGIIHRDIKPENILLDSKWRVKITDFGIAKIAGATPERLGLTGARDVVGTPHYMAPEQAILWPVWLLVLWLGGLFACGVIFGGPGHAPLWAPRAQPPADAGLTPVDSRPRGWPSTISPRPPIGTPWPGFPTPAEQRSAFPAGAKVEVEWAGSSRSGVVIERHGPMARIRFEDSRLPSEMFLPTNRLRLR